MLKLKDINNKQTSKLKKEVELVKIERDELYEIERDKEKALNKEIFDKKLCHTLEEVRGVLDREKEMYLERLTAYSCFR